MQISTCLAICKDVNRASPVNMATRCPDCCNDCTTTLESARVLHSNAMKPPKYKSHSTVLRDMSLDLCLSVVVAVVEVVLVK